MVPISLVVAFTFSGVPTASAVDPTPAKLSIRLESEPGIDDVDGSTLVLVRVEGAVLVPDQTAVLVDAVGEHAVRVTSVDVSNCANVSARTTGVGTTEWCLQLRGIDVGYEYTGTITPEGDEERTALTITLTARHNFIVWPMVVSLIAITAGVLWALWTGVRLRNVVSSSLLRAAIVKNRGPGGAPLVDDLVAKADLLLKSRRSADDVRAIVTAILGPGLERAETAREALGESLAQFTRRHPDFNDAALSLKAREIQTRPHRFNDFYTDSGDPITKHPAEAWIERIAKVSSLLNQLEKASSHIPQGKQALTDQANLVYESLRDATDDDGIELAKGHLDRLWEDVFPAAGQTLDEAMTQAGDDVVAHTTSAFGAIATVGLALLITVIGFAAIALAGVLSGTYVANKIFGTFWDYFALFLAAFASTSVAGIVAALAVTAVTKSK